MRKLLIRLAVSLTMFVPDVTPAQVKSGAPELPVEAQAPAALASETETVVLSENTPVYQGVRLDARRLASEVIFLRLVASERLNPPERSQAAMALLPPKSKRPSQAAMIPPAPPDELIAGLTETASQAQAATANGTADFHWGPALKQSLLFLAVQHGYAMTQAKTRRELSGPFFKDWFRSVAGLGGWADGGRFFTNYISHPMEGAVSGFIQIQNDPRGLRQEFGRSRSYWISRLKAMGWNAAYSTQFELGPISQSSIGNVGLHTSLDGKKRKMAYVDLVVTPTLGTAWLLGEDALDIYVVRWMESRTTRRLVRIPARLIFNPGRSIANLLRFKPPWYRDR